MEGTSESFGTNTIASRRKSILCKKVKMYIWKTRSTISWSHYLDGRSPSGHKENQSD